MFNYEKHRSAKGDYIYHQNDKNLSFALHFHNSYEFLYCYDGDIDVTIMDKTYKLNQGKSVLIAPMQAHAYVTPDFSETYLCVFSQDYISDFYEEHKDTEAETPVFSMYNPERLCRRLKEEKNKYAVKGLLYGIAAAFDQNTEFKPYDVSQYTMLHRIIEYVEDNYTKEISLKELSEKLGHSYNYVSSVFNEIFGAGFNEVVNGYRINKAERLLREGNTTVNEAAARSGYSSIRSFNRNFLKYTGRTPSEVLKK